MKITYTGIAKFSPAQQKKLDAKFAKLSKLLDGRGEKEAHVILATERHLQRAEITVNYYDHPLVGLHSHSDTLTAITGAVDRLEKQIVKVRTKRRDSKRTPDAKGWSAAAEATKRTTAAPAKAAPKKKAAAKPKAAPVSEDPQVFRVNSNHHKPMTLEEAMLEMDGTQDYMVYRDAASERTRVLVKRPDGNFDLIEA